MHNAPTDALARVQVARRRLEAAAAELDAADVKRLTALIYSLDVASP
jgi:hypothetical protein